MKIEIDPYSLAVIIIGILGSLFIYFYDWSAHPLIKNPEAEVQEDIDAGVAVEAPLECVPSTFYSTGCPSLKELQYWEQSTDR